MKNFQNDDNDQVNLLFSSKSDYSDNYINKNYVMSDIEDNKILYRNKKFSDIKEEEEESTSKRKRNSEILKNENLPLQIEKNKKTIYNFLINSSNSEINVNSSKDESNNNSIDHLKMENLYLEDGSLTTNLMNPYINNNNSNNNNLNENKSKNEEKIKLDNLKLEIQKNIYEQENNDLENSKEIDYHLISSMSSQRKKYENIENIENNEIDFEINEKIRNEKEKEIKEKIVNELRPKIYDEIYKKEYKNIVNEIKIDIENELKDNLEIECNEEINIIKQNLDDYQKIQKEEIDKNIQMKCQNEMIEEINKICDIREKDFKLKNSQKIELFKKKLEQDLNNEYEKKKKDYQKEINKLKSKIFQSHITENLKMNKINELKKNIERYNEENIKSIQTIDKILNSKEIEDSEINNADDENSSLNSKKKIKPKKYAEDTLDTHISTNIKTNMTKANSKRSIHSTQNHYKKLLSHLQIDDKIIQSKDDNDKSNVKINNEIINNDDYNTIDNKSNLNDNSINLFEINKRIKNRRNSKSVNRTFNFIEPKISVNNSIYNYNTNNNHASNNNSFYSQKINLTKNNFPISPIYSYKNIGAYNNTKTNNITNTITNFNTKTNIEMNQNDIIENNEKELNENIENNKKINQKINESYNNKPKSKTIFYSLQINKNIPISISEFGKYLIKHIEKEERYKILYYNEIKKFKLQIQKIFKQSKKTDHFLTECLFDLWNKVNTSFYTRYQILKQIVKFSAEKLYEFLDIETEYLSNYYQISQNIFREIEKRENLKAKLQTKANRNELKNADKENLDEITKNLEILIQNFQKKFKKLDIIWKGLRYNWFMNYENWFYDMEKKQNNNSLKV